VNDQPGFDDGNADDKLGIGGGGMTTVVSILMSDVIPLRQRGTWQGYLNIVFATGASAGAPLGGILADSIGWRW
jgi:MFS family permease